MIERSLKGKGKQRAVVRDEGSGGTEGIVLPLDMVGSGVYDVAYTIPMRVGSSNKQNFSFQVDTGSSDLWVASTSCSSSECSQTSGRLYNPQDATDTSVTFSISYLRGNVSGPIVWDQVEVGGYSIANQALSAADTVVDESLSYNFNGILGLALPINSVIAQSIPPVTSNSPDGAAFASNLFSITPATNAPSARFISLSLSRPGSDRIPAALGIGRHPSGVVSDPSQIRYSSLLSESSGTLYWKMGVRAITVYVNGEAKPVTLGRSSSGEVFPSAVVDSGVPLILTTSAIANGIYGAIGVSPASDGKYYVPCDTPLNMTINLDDRPEIPLHPLDLTAPPPQDATSQNCIGLIQSADQQLASPRSAIGDMILGVPFMRNAYTVMAYDAPDSKGNFVSNGTGTGIKPRLGLLNLTDPKTAQEEFRRVRVLNQPLSPSGQGVAPVSGGKKMSVGLSVLIGLLSFVALCIALFALRWVVLGRRRWRKGGAGEFGRDRKGLGAYRLARRGSQSADGDGLPSEDALRQMRFEAYMRKQGSCDYSTSTGKTRVGDGTVIGDEEGGEGELGYVAPAKPPPQLGAFLNEQEADPWDPATALDWGGGTPMSPGVGLGTGAKEKAPPMVNPDEHEDDVSPEWPTHQRTPSQLESMEPGTHARVLSVSLPLLPSTMEEDDEALPPDDDLGEFGLVSAGGMAGVGTAARGGKIGPGLRQGSMGSIASAEGLGMGPSGSGRRTASLSPTLSRGS